MPVHEQMAQGLRQWLVFMGICTILLPIGWIALTAFKLPRDVYSLSTALHFSPTLENLHTIFKILGTWDPKS